MPLISGTWASTTREISICPNWHAWRSRSTTMEKRRLSSSSRTSLLDVQSESKGIRSILKECFMIAATDQKVGKIVQVIGSTFDAEFDEGHLPEIYNALRIHAEYK